MIENCGMVQTFAAEGTKAIDSVGREAPIITTVATIAYPMTSAAALAQAANVTGIAKVQLTGLDLAPAGARAELLSELVKMDAERAGVSEQYITLSARLAKEQVTLHSLAPTAARLQDLQRDFSVAEAVFATAIARAQSTKSDVYASYPLVQVLENPSLPDRPSSPNRKLALAAGAAATFMLLIGLVLGWVRSAVIRKVIKAPEVTQ